MRLSQNDMERLSDQVHRGLMTAEQANVEKVRTQRVLLATGRIPSDVRKALNAAVKRGELGHMKKDGNKPEAYYHPTFEYLAKGARAEHERSVVRALLAVCA
jgi:hypothetical protein